MISPSCFFLVDATPRQDKQDAAIIKIDSFVDLPNGWHYGEGRGATKLAVNSARTMHALLMEHNVNEVEVFPDANGGILLSGYYDEETLEVFCDHDGKINILHEVGNEITYEKDDVSAQEVKGYVGGLLWKKFMIRRFMKLSDYFIQITSVEQREDLQVWHSEIPQRMVASRLLRPNVLQNVVEQNVDIYSLSTPP